MSRRNSGFSSLIGNLLSSIVHELMKGSLNKSTKMDIHNTPDKKEMPPLKERFPFIILLVGLLLFIVFLPVIIAYSLR